MSIRTAAARNTLTLSALVLIGLLSGLLSAPAQAYEIGSSQVTWTDPARGDRSIPALLYYPAEAAGADVPVAPAPAGGFPVLAFGHGFLMSAGLYDYIWEALVPAGYVVILPETETSLFPTPDHLDLGLDLAFLVQRLAELGADPAGPFHQRIGDRAAVLGHSMGGGAALLAAAADPTLDAVAALAPAETDPSAIAAAGQVTVPVLLFSGSVDCVTPAADTQAPMFDALAGDCRARVTLLGASHCQFAESSGSCNLGETLAGCDAPSLSRAQQQALVLALLEPWLGAVLQNDPVRWEQFRQLATTSADVVPLIDCAFVSHTPPRTGAVVLHGAHPNPFNPGTVISFELQQAARVELEIHDLQGRLVRRMVRESLPAGPQGLRWNGRDGHGRSAGSGLYLYRLLAAGEVRQGKLTLLK